jgi:hypothetical protein
MGKMLDPKNVTVRAERMMRDHLSMFQEYFGDYEREGSRYCFVFDDNTGVKVYYEDYSKFLTKTFSTTVKITVSNVTMKKSWKAKLNLSGKIKVERISLKALNQDSRDMVDELNDNTELIGKLLALIKGFDLQAMTMEYRKDEQEMDITIRPYPGAFIWVKMPPIYYDIRLKPEEVKRIHEITELFSKFYNKDMLM